MTTLAFAHILSIFATGLVFGGMAFFLFGTAPLVFRVLPRETAASFVREAFALYYAVMAGAAGVAALAFALSTPMDAIFMGAVAAMFLLLRQMLIPALDALRVRAAEGDAAAKRSFARLHGGSVAVSLVQLFIVGVVLSRFVI